MKIYSYCGRVYHALIGPLLIMGVMACQGPADPTSTSSPQAVKLPVGSAVIRSLTIDDFPRENIRINDAEKTITITIPADVNQMRFVPSISVASGYQIDAPYTFRLCGASATESLRLINKAGTSAVFYQVIKKPAGPMSFDGELTSPAPGQPSRNVQIRVINAYDSVNWTKATLKSNETGATFQTYIHCTDTPNVFTLSIDPDIPQGEYQVSLVSENGRTSVETRRLTLPKAVPVVNYNPYSLLTPGVTNYRLTGTNLREADNLTCTLRNKRGNLYLIKPKSYAENGQEITIDLPSDIQPDYYRFEWRMGDDVMPFQTFSIPVVDGISRHSVIHIYDTKIWSSSESFVLKRGKEYRAAFTPVERGKARIKLTSVANPTQTYHIEVDLADGHQENLRTRFVMPMSVPAGLYYFSLQPIDADTGLTLPQFVDVE